MIEIDERETERYLGVRGAEVNDEVLSCIRVVSKELQNISRPRWTGTSLPLSFAEGFPVIDGTVRRSKALAKNLQGCEEVILFAATIGPGCDRLIQRYEAVSVTKAAIAQAAGSAMIEAYVSGINEDLRKDAELRGLYARPRFSPGYGDLPLEMQKDFSRILDMPKTIGVRLCESLLMVPSKSVTALIGLSPVRTDCPKSGCEDCERRNTCEYGR
jgi:hypothetical protein